MKTKITLLALSSIISIILIVFSGCYTQLGSQYNEKEGDEEYTATDQQNDDTYSEESESDDYTYNSEYSDDFYHPRVGFSYYYPSSYWPSTAFSMAYADPWFYDYAWGYNSWNNYYSPVWNPFYGYNPYSYYSPYYSDYYGYGYSSYSGRRTDGSILSTGHDREVRTGGYEIPITGRSDINLPVGASLGKAPGSAPPNRNSSNVQNSSRRRDDGVQSVRRDDWGHQQRVDNNVRASGQGERKTQGVRRRDTRPQSQPRETNSPPPTYQTPPPATQGNAPSHTTPSSPPPRQSSPSPSSNSGSKRNDGGDRSSNDSRGRRP